MHIRHFGKFIIMCAAHIGTWKIHPSPDAFGSSIPASTHAEN